jgi:hypothetical protein
MTDATSVEQIEQAKPRRPRGAPARTRSHNDAILALLRERGPHGVLGSELYDAPHLYGRSPRNRISECRRDGHLIEGKPRGASDWHYVLIRENESPTTRSAPGKPVEQIKLADSPDWYEREHGPRPASAPIETTLPLFKASEASRA